MKTRSWTRVDLRLSEPYQDLLVGQLAALGFGGFLQESSVLSAFIRSELWKPALQEKLEKTLAAFHGSFPDVDASYSVATVEEENWNRRWERSSGIVEATERIVIKPSWKKLRKKDRGKIVLHIDPKMSFGTGHHETTRLSLRLLESAVSKGMSVLDFGCGTGVLAIAAVKLGAARADCVDIDDWAIINTKENIGRNRCGTRIRARKGDVKAIPRKRYDLIVSNTDVPTLVASLATLVSLVKPGRPILISGIMVSDLEAIHALAQKLSLVPLEVISENEWAALRFLSPDAPRRR